MPKTLTMWCGLWMTPYLPVAGISQTDPLISQTVDERTARGAHMSASFYKIWVSRIYMKLRRLTKLKKNHDCLSEDFQKAPFFTT